MLYCANNSYLYLLHIHRSLPETEKLTTQLHVLAVERDKLMELVACMQDR